METVKVKESNKLLGTLLFIILYNLSFNVYSQEVITCDSLSFDLDSENCNISVSLSSDFCFLNEKLKEAYKTDYDIKYMSCKILIVISKNEIKKLQFWEIKVNEVKVDFNKGEIGKVLKEIIKKQLSIIKVRKICIAAF